MGEEGFWSCCTSRLYLPGRSGEAEGEPVRLPREQNSAAGQAQNAPSGCAGSAERPQEHKEGLWREACGDGRPAPAGTGVCLWHGGAAELPPSVSQGWQEVPGTEEGVRTVLTEGEFWRTAWKEA